MVITNKLGLPQAVVDLVKDNEGHELNWDRYSVTELLGSTREIILNRRYDNVIEQDVSQMTNLILGSAVHNLIEKYDKTNMAEYKLECKVGSKTLVGRVDLYDEVNHTIVDWKTATVMKVLKQDFKDYDKQGLMYSWLAIKNCLYVGKYKFILFLKDWTARELRLAKLKGDFYPESAIYVYEVNITADLLNATENEIKDKINELELAEQLADDELPDCEETWYTGDKWAVYKNLTDARAQRVLDTEKEANDYVAAKGGKVMFRKGQHRKCQDYCSCCEYCKYYKERKAE